MAEESMNNKGKNISEKWNKCMDGKYKHREKRGGLYIYVDHTINSARGQERRGCKVGGRVIYLFMVLK